MADKLLIFHVAAIDSNSVSAATDGANVDYAAFPASKLSNIRVNEDKVYLNFDSAGLFDDQDNHDGAVNMRKTEVELAAVEDSEHLLVKDIYEAIVFGKGAFIEFDNINSLFPSPHMTAVTSITDAPVAAAS